MPRRTPAASACSPFSTPYRSQDPLRPAPPAHSALFSHDLTEKGTKEAIEKAEQLDDSVLVIYLEHCHESIAGIIAGRVREKYNKPTIVLTDAVEGVKGSGRSIEEYDMYAELTKVKELFTKFGGHKMAAGVSLQKENIDILRKKLNENCNLTQEDLYLKVWIDMQLPLEYVTMNMINMGVVQ